MSRLFYSDFGIDIKEPTLCPRCGKYTLEIDEKKETWYDPSCHWGGRIRDEEDLIQNASDAAPHIERWKDGEIPVGVSLGWKDLDPLLTVLRGEWTVVTGYASHGKSQFMDAVMVNMASQHGWKFGIFSPENVPYERHVKGLINKFLGKRFEDILTTMEEIRLARTWLKKYVFFVTPAQPTFEAVLAQFEKLVKTQKIEAVILDPWNEIEHEIPYGMNETQYTAMALIKFRKFCERCHVHGFIVTHPSKQFAAKRTEGDEGLKRPIIRLSDIAGSAHFENKAFNGISIWRNAAAEGSEKHFNHIHVLKVRNQDNGTTGKEILTWNPTTTCYSGKSELTEPDPPATKVKQQIGKLFGGDWTKSSVVKPNTSFSYGANVAKPN